MPNWIALHGLMNHNETSSRIPSAAPRRGAGGTMDRDTCGMRLLPPCREAPHIRHVFAPSATLAWHSGQRRVSCLTCTL